MRDADQLVRPLTNALPQQPRDPVLGHHGVGDLPRHGDDLPGLELRDDRGDRPADRGGREHADVASTRSEEGSEREGEVPAHAGVDTRTDRVRADLPRQVHGQRAVDRNDVVVSSDVPRVGNVLRPVEFERAVAVDDLAFLRRVTDRGAMSALCVRIQHACSYVSGSCRSWTPRL